MPRLSGIWTISQISQAIQNNEWDGQRPSTVEYMVVAGGGAGGS